MEEFKEAEEYAKSISKNDTYKEYLKNAFIAGKNSKCENKQILQTKIDTYQDCLYYIDENYSKKYIHQKIQELQEQLKSLDK